MSTEMSVGKAIQRRGHATHQGRDHAGREETPEPDGHQDADHLRQEQIVVGFRAVPAELEHSVLIHDPADNAAAFGAAI